MCGINGFFLNNQVTCIENRIQRMNDSLVHRGPDAEGTSIFSDGKVAIGQRRLSIIDVDARSNQPMASATGKWVIVYNGEIYNFLDLKKKVDYPFQTNSDTEVILAYVEQFGVERFLDDCNGMFSLCLYNTEFDYMILARDRMGIKPLYYYYDTDKFIFSSEIKGILSSGMVKSYLNESAIDEYLGNRYIRAPYTFFSNIYQLAPASKLFVYRNNGSIRMEINSYWKLPEFFNFATEYNENEILEEFSDEVCKAIQRRLISDVPLGTYLSGGVDSSLITAIASIKMEKPINTYTIGFAEDNEFQYAELVEKRYQTIHHKITIDYNEYFKNLKRIIFFKDAPLGIPNEIPLALMSEVLKKDITVVLSGEGADELMGGYGRIYRSAFDFENNNLGSNFYEYFCSLYEYVPRKIRDRFLKTPMLLRERFDKRIKEEFVMHRNEENIFRYFHKYHVQGLLQRVDSTTMLASVEARVPFLDHRLIEFCYTKVPYDLKLHWKSNESHQKAMSLFSKNYSELYDVPKYLLKQMAYKYLPKTVIERKKVGFPVPLAFWINEIQDIAKNVLSDAYWMNHEALDDFFIACKTNARFAQIIWMFINIEVFRKLYFDKDWRY